jgi:hypothetical protein
LQKTATHLVGLPIKVPLFLALLGVLISLMTGTLALSDDSIPFSVRLSTIPPRPADSMTGSEFAARTAGLSRQDRQLAALEELRKGNVPEFLREMKPVTLKRDPACPGPNEAVIFVAPDYLAIGSDEDFLRMPLDFPTAVAACNDYGCILPTPQIVDAVYEQAEVKLCPEPKPAGSRMCSNEYFLEHQRTVEKQRNGQIDGALIAGHKKDLVLTERLLRKPNSVAIYGWHRPNGKPIQPLSTVHVSWYADYSHGVRPIWPTAWIDGKPVLIEKALEDPILAGLFTRERAIPCRDLMCPTGATFPEPQ